LLSILKATVEGVATLRAYGVERAKRSAFVAALDAQTVTTFACVARWRRALGTRPPSLT
jgi:hypothetical protein